MKGSVGETKEKRVAVVNTGGDRAVYKDGGGVGGEEWAKAINVT